MDYDIILTKASKMEQYAGHGFEVWSDHIIDASYAGLIRDYGEIPQKGMRDLYGKYKGETVFVCGSGPSLASCPEKLPGPTIAINRAITKVKADYWGFVDMEAWRLYGQHENAKGAAKLFGSGLYIMLKDVAPAYLIEACGSPNRYERADNRPLYFNCNTFSWVIHLAIKMGAKRIVTIGCEFSLTPYFDGFMPQGYEVDRKQEGLMLIGRDRMLEMFGADMCQWYDPSVELLDASGGALPIPKVKLEDVL